MIPTLILTLGGRRTNAMGITIHYSGKARGYDALTELLTTAQRFAARHDWPMAIYDDPMGVLEDLDKDEPGYLEYDGPLRGIVLKPHRKCEAVRLDFNLTNEFSASTKTQYAPFRIHAQIVELLRAIEPFLERLEVIDESGFWESGDAPAARERFATLDAAMGALASELEDEGFEVEGPGLEGPTEPDPGDDRGDSPTRLN